MLFKKNEPCIDGLPIELVVFLSYVSSHRRPQATGNEPPFF